MFDSWSIWKGESYLNQISVYHSNRNPHYGTGFWRLGSSQSDCPMRPPARRSVHSLQWGSMRELGKRPEGSRWHLNSSFLDEFLDQTQINRANGKQSCVRMCARSCKAHDVLLGKSPKSSMAFDWLRELMRRERIANWFRKFLLAQTILSRLIVCVHTATST